MRWQAEWHYCLFVTKAAPPSAGNTEQGLTPGRSAVPCQRLLRILRKPFSLFHNLSVTRLLDIAAALFASLVLIAIAVMVTIL